MLTSKSAPSSPASGQILAPIFEPSVDKVSSFQSTQAHFPTCENLARGVPKTPVFMDRDIVCFTDGSSKNNPGFSAQGASWTLEQAAGRRSVAGHLVTAQTTLANSKPSDLRLMRSWTSLRADPRREGANVCGLFPTPSTRSVHCRKVGRGRRT